MAMDQDLDKIIEDFAFLEDWEDRYRYVMELGKAMPDFPETLRSTENKVNGCASQVWLATKVSESKDAASPILTFVGDSDSALVRGLIAILLATYSGKSADHILKASAFDTLQKLGLQDHITPQRSNGFAAMAQRIVSDAQTAISKM
ncbi:MAG: SufE family protein [Pseudomonadota bacterium]